MTSFYSI